MIGRITDSMKSIILFVILCCSVEFSYAQMSLTNPFGINLSRPTKSSSQLTFDTQNIRIPQVISQDDSPILNLKPYTKELEKAAKGGDASSQAEVGKCYLFGSGVGVDYKKAQKWFEQAIEQNNADAIFWMGYMYENKLAKKIKLASGWDKHFMYDHGASVKDDEEKAYREAPQKYYEQAASLGQPDALYKLYRKNKDLTNLRSAAEKGNMKAQYDLGAYFLNQFSSSKNDETNLSLAKEWFTKAAENGHPDAAKCVSGIEDTERQIEVAKREAEERARKEAVEAARRDSIAAVERARQMAEAERQRKQDSIDIAEGRKLPNKKQLLSGCSVFQRTTAASYSYEYKNSNFYKELVALCNNEDLTHYGKSRMMAIVFPLDKDSEPEWEFSSTGFSFRANGTKPSPTDNTNLLGLMDLVFPVNPNLVKPDDHMKCWHTFKCNNLEKLREIRANKDCLEMLYIFKPGLQAISRYWSADSKDYVYLVNPVALYLVNSISGEVVLDLSNCLRKTRISADRQRIESYAKAKYKKIMSEKTTPRQVVCFRCGGKGYINTSAGKERCTWCYGRGYEINY